MPRFSDIKPFTRDGNYRIDVSVGDIDYTISRYEEEYGLQLNPDFQRGHVWTEAQQSAFVEYVLRGGITSEIRLNHPGWQSNYKGDFVCVDGLQRITAVRRFTRNEIKAFGYYYNEYEDKLNMLTTIGFRVNNLKTRAEVLQWYIDLNAGGTVHSDEEINRVKKLLEEEK